MAVSQAKGATTTRNGRASSRNKREQILRSAVEHFGTYGYDDTKWADIASDVGIGATALYHYFESKHHCLFDIMTEAITAHLEAFEKATRDTDWRTGLVRALRSGFDLTDYEVRRMRVLVDKQGLIAVKRSSVREEKARMLARERTRDLEFAWASFLVRGMDQGVIPETDARLLARAVLGLNKSVWEWYRPEGSLPLSQVADFYIRRQLMVIGLPPELVDEIP